MGKAKIIPEKGSLLLPYQARWVTDTARLKLIEKSRQIGISWASAYSLVRRKAATKPAGGLDAWVSSRDEIQARLFLDDCKAFAGLLQTAAEDIGTQVVDTDGTTAHVLKLATGCKINSMSSSPDAQAGKRGDRLLDEFALHKDPRKLYAIAYPGITWGGQLEIVSTHRGSANFFNEIVREIKEKNNPKKISLHTVTLQTALDQGFLYKLQAKLPADDERQEMDEAAYFDYIRSGCADEESFLQEYMCVPADDASAFLTYDMIAACEYSRLETWELDLKTCGNLYVGVDVARKKDLTIIWVNEFAGERHMTRRVIKLEKMRFSLQEDVLYEILALPNMRRCCIDQSGIGMQFAERAMEKYGRYRVEGITFTAPVKEALAYPLRAAFEDLNLRIPEDKFIRADLRSIKKETTAAEHVRFSADHSKNGHADRFWALALAIHARGKGDGDFQIAAAKSEEEKARGDKLARRGIPEPVGFGI
jgi:phage FluMu gp28-like protein